MKFKREEEIKEILREFREKTHVLCSILFDEDGLLIASDKKALDESGEIQHGISAIFANLLSIAQDGISFLKLRNNVKQLIIQAGTQVLDEDAFTVIIESVVKNVILSIIFPSTLNISVILFETKGMIKKLSDYLKQYELE